MSTTGTAPAGHRESITFAGRTLTIETGRYAKQAGGAAWVSYGNARLLVTAQGAKLEQSKGFLALTVDYVEKTYAAGRFPGGFFKREGKLSTHEVLTSRLIDRPLRPLFPEGLPHEIQVIATVHSADEGAAHDVLGLIGASTAVHLSDLPWAGPVAAIRVALIDGAYVGNPTPEQLTKSKLNVLVAAKRDAIVMVEGEAQEASEAELIGALLFAHESVIPVIDLQERLRAAAGKPKAEFTAARPTAERTAAVRSALEGPLAAAFRIADKQERYGTRKKLLADFITALPAEEAAARGEYEQAFHELEYEVMRTNITEHGARVDGRALDAVRPIWIETGVLPRAHGSAVFTRGETQILGIVTLGTKTDAQLVENLQGATDQKFMVHYNFPPYSVGEVKRLGTPGRREVGHGFLAERALKMIAPPESADFPYTIRVVSEVMESNGSSSMGTVCAGSLALMDAGVPVRKPVAGIAMGLIAEKGKTAILSDILGDEDHLGDMDFKVCGTTEGVTALQMDIKIDGLSRDVLERALEQARLGRLHILGEMGKVLNAPRSTISPYAPRISKIQIPVDKIRDVIGSGGKTIRQIIATTGVQIDVADNGEITIASSNEAKAAEAIDIIRSLTAVPEVGRIYRGIVKRVAEFGAFVEILPGKDGLCHISQLDTKRVRAVTDVVNEGDELEVQVLSVEPDGKIKLSHRAIIEMREAKQNG